MKDKTNYTLKIFGNPIFRQTVVSRTYKNFQHQQWGMGKMRRAERVIPEPMELYDKKLTKNFFKSHTNST